jgi:hypothetical protein
MKNAKILFLHGLESGPNGKKAMFLKKHFGENVYIPDLRPTFFIIRSYYIALNAINEFQPDIIISSSFGSIIHLFLLQNKQNKLFRNNIIMSCAMGLLFKNRLGVPWEMKNNTFFIHGIHDTLCNPMDLVIRPRIRHNLYFVDDTHSLNNNNSMEMLLRIINNFRKHKLSEKLTRYQIFHQTFKFFMLFNRLLIMKLFNKYF